MMIESMRIWAGLEDEIGEDVGFERGGCFIMAEIEKYLEETAEWLNVARDYQLDTRIVQGRELDGLVEGASKNWVGAMYTESDGRAEPHKAAPAIGRAAQCAGARIFTSCAVRGIERQAGRVSSVVTEHGTILTSNVLCAAGAWTSMFCRSLGISLPQLKARSTVARLGTGPHVLNGNAFDEKPGIRRRKDGGYTIAHGFQQYHPITPSSFRFGLKFLPAWLMEFNKIRFSLGRDLIDELKTSSKWSLDLVSPFEKQRVLNPAPNLSELKKARQAVDRFFPALAGSAIVESWAGMVEVTPDVVPVMCESDLIPGFFIATGYSGHGFGIGPGAGKAAAGMLTNTESGIDLSEFNLKRFFDGSPINPHSSV